MKNTRNPVQILSSGADMDGWIGRRVTFSQELDVLGGSMFNGLGGSEKGAM